MGLFDFGYKRRLWFSLQDNYGRRPDPFYAAGDMSTIRSYHDYMREQEPDVFHIDDVTWSDLDMDRVFKAHKPRPLYAGRAGALSPPAHPCHGLGGIRAAHAAYTLCRGGRTGSGWRRSMSSAAWAASAAQMSAGCFHPLTADTLAWLCI